MLDGRYPSKEFGELRARIVWDRLAGTIRARKGSRQLAIANAGTIPDRGLYAVTLPDGRRVGELDEEMVYEARPGQAFLLGASTWRIEEIGRDRVIVTPAPGAPGAVPFWKGDSVGRPIELGRAIGAFSRWAVEQEPETLQRDYDLDERAARNLLAYLREQQAATRVLPSERTIVLERFRDEIGDWRLCVLSPYGGRVHAAWGLALSARIRERFGLEADAISSDDGIVLHLPRPRRRRGRGAADRPPSSCCSSPTRSRRRVTAELGGSALFGARFRENAARALLIPRAYPGRRTPLWQQRLKAQNLLEVARRYADFPIVLETYRECLRDVLDVPGLQELLRGLHTREISLVEVETADRLAVCVLAAVRLRRDLHVRGRHAQRRAPRRRAVARPRPAARAARPGGAARADRPRRARARRRRPAAPLGDDARDRPRRAARRAAPRRRPESTRRSPSACSRASTPTRCCASSSANGARSACASAARSATSPPTRPASTATRSAPCPPAGCRRRSSPTCPTRCASSSRATRAPTGRSPPTSCTRAMASTPAPCCASSSAPASSCAASCGPGGSEREWCDVEVLRRLRRASLAALRKEIEPADQRRLAAFLPSWQGVDRHARAGAGIDRLREVLVPLQGLALPVEIWERDVLPRRTGAYSQSWLDSLCASGELVWVGAGALGAPGAWRCTSARTRPRSGRRRGGRAARAARTPPSAPEHELLRARLAQGPCFFTDLLAELDAPAEALREALWDLVWAGEVTNDAWAPLRAPRLALARGSAPACGRRSAAVGERPSGARRASPPAPRQRRAVDRSRAAGRSRRRLRRRSADGPAGAAERRRALAELLLERYGIVTREQVLAEGIKGGFAMLYDTFAKLETLGVCRRGYFIEGMGGAQFALPGAVERLRAGARCGGERAQARARSCSPPPTPPSPTARRCRGPSASRRPSVGRPARVAGAYVVLVEDSRCCTSSAAGAAW